MKLNLKKILPATMLAIATIVPISAEAQSNFAKSKYDMMTPFGYATCLQREETNPTELNISGGGAAIGVCVYTYEKAVALMNDPSSGVRVKKITCKNVTSDDDIKKIIRDNDVIIFDGQDGDFIIHKYITIQNQNGATTANNKTILGINNARLVTEWYVTPEILKILKEADVQSASTSKGTGGKLPNGVVIDEEAEYLTRKALYEKYGNENYRESGVFSVKRAQNLIFRNLSFIGPGAIDCGGYDLLAIQYSKNVWVDHCEFIDGIDGNFDISNESDMITASWNEFSYTDRSLMHQNTSLIGSSDSKEGDDDKLTITFAFNSWGAKCRARMPMARFGRFHMINNYFHCKGNSTACINPRLRSEFIIEGNYFEEGVKKIYEQAGATAVFWAEDNIVVEKFNKPNSFGDQFIIPYYMEKMPTEQVKDDVKVYAGPTIWGSTKYSVIPEGEVSGIKTISTANEGSDAIYNIAGQKVSADSRGLLIKNGKKYIAK